MRKKYTWLYRHKSNIVFELCMFIIIKTLIVFHSNSNGNNFFFQDYSFHQKNVFLSVNQGIYQSPYNHLHSSF